MKDQYKDDSALVFLFSSKVIFHIPTITKALHAESVKPTNPTYPKTKISEPSIQTDLSPQIRLKIKLKLYTQYLCEAHLRRTGALFQFP